MSAFVLKLIKPVCSFLSYHPQSLPPSKTVREEAALDIFGYIEAVHNRARTHSALGYMSPVESEEANWPDGEGRPRAA